jgi:predicted ATP-grasp superfamily ATP-dependent carboligase
VFLPTGEDTVVVAKYINDLEKPGVKIPIAAYSTLRRLHKKDEVATLAASLGIPIPKTIVPRSVGDVEAFGRDVGFPVVLKRISSSSARGVSYLQRDDLAAMPAGSTFEGMIAQEYVSGTGYGVSMLFNRGAIRAKFSHKRLQELPSTGGPSVLRVGVVCPVLEEYAQRLLEHVNFHGVAMVEFKRNEATGQSWLIEVNPRFWGSLALAIQSGVDFPHLLYRMASDGDVDPLLTYRSGVVMRWLLGSVGRSFTRSERSPSVPNGERLTSAGYDDFHWDDPLAVVGGAALALWKRLATSEWNHDRLNLSIERLDQAGATERP